MCSLNTSLSRYITLSSPQRVPSFLVNLCPQSNCCSNSFQQRLILLVTEFHVNGIVQYSIQSSVGFLLCNIMFLKSAQCVACISTWFLLLGMVRLHCCVYFQSPVDGHLSWSQFGAVINKAVMGILSVCVWRYFSRG